MFEVGDLEVAVVNEPLVVLGDAASHAVVGHGDEWRSGGVGSGGVEESPLNWAVFAIVGDGPAIPRRGRDLPGEVFASNPLAM